MGHDPMNWQNAGGISPSGKTTVDRQTNSEGRGEDPDVPPSEKGDIRGRAVGGGDLFRRSPKHGHIVHHDQPSHGNVSGVGAAP